MNMFICHITRLTMLLSASFLLVTLLTSGSVTNAAAKDSHRGHKHDHSADGVKFDHEAVLGSYKLEKEFSEMPAEQAKEKLALLVKKMDKNHDGFVEKQELVDWIMMSFRLLDQEEADDQFKESDANRDNKLTWSEHLEKHHSYTEKQINELLQAPKDDAAKELLALVEESRKKFVAADTDGDGVLSMEENIAFEHPQNYPHMHKLEIEKEMKQKDKNKDGFLSIEEYVGDAAKDKEEDILERQRFNDYDKNNDSKLSYDELAPSVVTDNKQDAEEEAKHLIEESDKDEDGKLTEEEIVDHSELFVGGQVTDYGRHLHFVKRAEEL